MLAGRVSHLSKATILTEGSGGDVVCGSGFDHAGDAFLVGFLIVARECPE